MKVEQKDEAIKILKIIEQYFPKIFHGVESVKWLHQHSSQGRQDEWAAFFFEEYSFPLLTNFLGGWKGPRITRDKRFDYQREFVFTRVDNEIMGHDQFYNKFYRNVRLLFKYQLHHKERKNNLLEFHYCNKRNIKESLDHLKNIQ